MRIVKTLYVSVLLVILLSGQLRAQQGGGQIASLKTYTESEYLWDAQTPDWQLSAIMKYGYDPEGNLTELVKYNALSGDSISRVDYYYDQSSELSAYIVSLWSGQTWVPNTRYSYTYSSAGKESQRIGRWNGAGWINGSLDTLYVYGIDGHLLQSENFKWKNGYWVKDHTIFYEYGENGKLMKKYSISPTGEYLSQVFYQYDLINRLSEMVAQFYRNGQWENEWRRTYIYDRCGVLKTLIRQAWDGIAWSDVLKSEFEHTIYWNGPVKGKVVMCHKGRTIMVSVNVMEIHLQHGDCIGNCSQGAETDTRNNLQDLSSTQMRGSYIIYPNPASYSFSISAANGSDPIIKVELYDSKGNLVKSIPGNNCSELIVDKGDLKSGKYFVVISGKTPFSSTVILN
jgi:hypothetical protein